LVGNEILIGVDSREYSAECKKEGSLLYVPYEVTDFHNFSPHSYIEIPEICLKIR